MRAPSKSIQHSSMPEFETGAVLASALEPSRSDCVTFKFFRPNSQSNLFQLRDNSFPSLRFYLSEHRLCSLHLGSFGSPFFRWGFVRDTRLPFCVLRSLRPS